MKPWSKIKVKFSLSENSHSYWIQLNKTILKAWKENLYKEDKNFHDLTFRGHYIIENNRIYSLSKCTTKELYSLQVFLNDSNITCKET